MFNRVSVGAYKYIIFTLLILFILLYAAAANQFFVEKVNHDFGIASDYLYGFETALNFLHQQSLAGQDFPAAPYYFPDLVIMTLFATYFKNITTWHFAYSILFLLSYVFIVYLLFKSVLKQTSTALWGTLLSVICYFSILNRGIFFLIDWPLSHLSVALYSLWFFWFYLTNAQKKFSLAIYSLLFGVTFLVFISDNLLFTQLFAPLSLIIFYDKLTHKITLKKALYYLGMFSIITLSGANINYLFENFGASFSLNHSLYRLHHIEQLPELIRHAGNIFRQSFYSEPIFYSLEIFYLLTGFILYSAIFRANIQERGKVLRIGFFLYLSPVCSIILALLAQKIHGIGHFRYVDVVFIYPPIAFTFAILVFLKNNKWFKTLSILLSLSVTLVIGVFFYHQNHLLKKFTLQPLYNESVQCVDELVKKYDIHNGLAEYWRVRPLRMISHSGIMINQIDKKSLNFLNMIDNKSYYFSDKKQTQNLTYQFIIINLLPVDKIIAAVGKPDKIVYCPHNEVWLYMTKNSQQRLNNFFSVKEKGIHGSHHLKRKYS